MIDRSSNRKGRDKRADKGHIIRDQLQVAIDQGDEDKIARIKAILRGFLRDR